MELENRSISATSARILKAGEETVEVTAGKSLVIETSPAGTEVLSEEVPTGKVWTATIKVDIIETDA